MKYHDSTEVGRFDKKTPVTECFDGKYYSGKGDVEYLQLLDIARRMFDPDPEFQNMPMLYTPKWNGLVEGLTWDAWWIQNSYGTTYCALPFYQEPLLTFLQNSQDLWFNQIGDGQRVGKFNLIAPDGCLCDCANLESVYYKQGDCRIDIHDWAVEFTAAGLLMQAELLLISRDAQAITCYLSKLERCANFIETRRDPKNNLFLAGPAANLLAPSYAGWKCSDGTYGQSYLTGISITYIAALDRLIELEKLSGDNQKVALYSKRRELARKGLYLLMTDEEYFIKSLDSDGTRHGVYGAAKHGYFESSPNHDAIAFQVVGEVQAEKIYTKIASIPELRPYDFIIANYPSLDDMYKEAELWGFGNWVDGGHWSTCEARMILGYYKLGKYEDVRRSIRRLLTFAKRFKMDNPLTKFGSDVYQPDKPINLCYDTFGPAAAMVRGLFEYLYNANGLTIFPHIPNSITELQQRFPIRFGKKKIYLSTSGNGAVTSVIVNGKYWEFFDEKSIFLPFEKTPEVLYITILLGDVKQQKFNNDEKTNETFSHLQMEEIPTGFDSTDDRVVKFSRFYNQLVKVGLNEIYEAAHTKLAVDYMFAVNKRKHFLNEGKIKPLSEFSQIAADRSYIDTAIKLCDGLENVVKSYANSDNPNKKKLHQIWMEISR